MPLQLNKLGAIACRVAGSAVREVSNPSRPLENEGNPQQRHGAIVSFHHR